MDKECRIKQLENLKEYINTSQNKLDSLLDAFEWDKTKIIVKSMVPCENDKNHQVPIDSFEIHKLKCNLKEHGYIAEESFLSEPLNHPNASVVISNEKKYQLFENVQNSSGTKSSWNADLLDPMTCDRIKSTFTTEERLLMYKYARKVTTGPPKVPEFNIISVPTTKELSYEEKLVQDRNAKRRRIKYKSVHTNRKNYTEILRGVITNNMEIYEDWIDEVTNGPKQSDNKKEAFQHSNKTITESDTESYSVSKRSRSPINSYSNTNKRCSEREAKRKVRQRSKSRERTSGHSKRSESMESNRNYRKHRSRSRERTKRYEESIDGKYNTGKERSYERKIFDNHHKKYN